MGLLVFGAAVLGLPLLGALLIYDHCRAMALRKAEEWAYILEKAESALPVLPQGATPMRCVLVTGYALPDEAAAKRLIEWVQSGTGEQTKQWPENDPTFGPYWVVETLTERVLVTPRLAAQWVARMRITCERTPCRLHHFGADFGGEPPTDAGAQSLVG